jgi:hypothetical protein
MINNLIFVNTNNPSDGTTNHNDHGNGSRSFDVSHDSHENDNCNNNE